MVNEPPESRDGEFKTSDVLITVLTSAALPVASRILTLAFGDNSLWSVDRLFIIYFASFSGWILRSYLQLVVERNGMRDKGYTFMDSDAAGNAIWTFPVVLALFCWNLIPGLISLLAIYCVAVFCFGSIGMSFALTWEEWYLSGCVRFLPCLSRKRSVRSICLIRYLKYINLLSIRLRWFLLFRLILHSIAFE